MQAERAAKTIKALQRGRIGEMITREARATQTSKRGAGASAINLTKRGQAFRSIDLMVEVRGLTKYYGDFRAVHDVTFTAERGEILGLLGPNGAGKTTT